MFGYLLGVLFGLKENQNQLELDATNVDTEMLSQVLAIARQTQEPDVYIFTEKDRDEHPPPDGFHRPKEAIRIINKILQDSSLSVAEVKSLISELKLYEDENQKEENANSI